MRKLQKNQIISTIGLLEKAHDAIKKAMDAGNPDAALTLLEQCQDSAIQIGGMIEESEGEGFATVELLENYCELLYLTYESIRQQQPVNVGKTYKNLRRELIRIENSVKNDIPVRTSAVFLPYKASMWDSLESLWKKAAADESCETFVIPIPYFDKNPDGSLGRMHYEGEQYPEEVPVTSWREYDMAARRPDVIYIHNPYDECNLVTSIHPDFYAKEIKEYTDMLVYVPYFTCINDVVQEEFCILPGTIWANQIILQSEAVREKYIEIFHRWEDSQGCRDAFGKAEEKFVALGSPKFDKVISAKREDYVLPEEWRRLIEREDGSRRKVVLYNTTLGAMLRDTEEMLAKIRNVFEVFRNQKEVVLLWRPHPLLRETLCSMRSRTVLEYDEIVERYRKEAWGIYDDTADMYQAITVSDAYYGDNSSVVELYKRTGKPIMIQNVKVSLEP